MDLMFTHEKLARRIGQLGRAAVRARQALGPVVWCAANRTDVAPPDATEWRELIEDEYWGAAHSCVWLRAVLEVPLGWRDAPLDLALLYPHLPSDETFIGFEANLYLDGALYAGIDMFHRSVPLPVAFADGAAHQVDLLVYTRVPLRWEGLELRVRDEAIWQLHQQMAALLGVVEQLDANSSARHALLGAINAAYNQLDLRDGWDGDLLAASAAEALATLDQTLAALPKGGVRPRIIANGHAHMDVAWLWPLWRTRQKIAHTVATALLLMERDPQYVFSMSQPQTFAYLKQDYPELYARLKQRAAEGRFEPIGNMWVEADCNIASGEALIRQLLHGAAFFEEEFGVDSPIVWLPDVFGYTAALPQIMRGCGISTFVTTKLSWSQTNRFPHDTFRWRGLDGSEVLAHIISAPTHRREVEAKELMPAGQGGSIHYTYNGVMEPWQVHGLWRCYREQALNDELLYLYGAGDGGGGPTEGMLHAARTMKALPDFPQVHLGRAEAFLRALYERVYERPDLPRWVGELYLEYHRGTYTSQAHTKRNNRLSELLYREAEWLSCWASMLGAPQRQKELDAGWKLLLLNQFHDILPGSSIAEVYEDARRDYAEVFAIGERVATASLDMLAGQVATSGPALLAVNSLPWDRVDVAVLPLEANKALPALMGRDDEPLAAQVVVEDGAQLALIDGLRVPSYGYAVVQLLAGVRPTVRDGLQVGEHWLESNELRVELALNGELGRVWDKRHGRELLLPGQTGNQLIAFEDRPLSFDAWDIDPFYEQKPYPVDALETLRVVETGPVRVAIEVVRRYNRSTIMQQIRLYASKPVVEFATVIDWNERQTLLKAHFPLNLNVQSATYEIQFGAVERPTHRNTSWDAARFEVCAHRWADMSEGNYGVALLNDGKYGHSAHGSTLGLTLLKSGISPDPTADQGLHRFTYALLPHAGDWRAGEVVRRAYELNAPLRVQRLGAQGGALSETASFLHCDAAHVVVETIKQAQNGDGLIVRLYEAHNARGNVGLRFAQEIASAEECDMRERPLATLTPDGATLRVEVRPFEVKTLRIRFCD